MTEDEFAIWSRAHFGCVTISASGPDRTLLYGYNTDRETWHLYLEDGLMTRVVYRDVTCFSHYFGHELSIERIVPNKRLYPEKCDFEFCMALRKIGVVLPFTTFTKDVAPKQFYGKRAFELGMPPDMAVLRLSR